MNILLWGLQGLIAMIMFMGGFLKIIHPNDELKKKGNGRMDWVDDISGGTMKWIGVIEVLAGLGLILPQLLATLPWLTPLAAAGVILTMSGAIILHVRRKDGTQALLINVVILLIAAFVAYGRFGSIAA